jgi:hypothetical protein
MTAGYTYTVIAWSGGFPPSAEYKSAKQPTCTPGTCPSRATRPAPNAALGVAPAPLAFRKPLSSAHMTHIMRSIRF